MTWSYKGVNRKRHERYRTNPDRKRLLLRQALEDMEVKDLSLETEFDNQGTPVWYNATFSHFGRTVAVFFNDPDARATYSIKTGKLNVRARQRKIDYAKSVNMPFIEIHPASKDYIRSQIEIWLVFMERYPFKEATKNLPPGWNKDGRAIPTRYRSKRMT